MMFTEPPLGLLPAMAPAPVFIRARAPEPPPGSATSPAGRLGTGDLRGFVGPKHGDEETPARTVHVDGLYRWRLTVTTKDCAARHSAGPGRKELGGRDGHVVRIDGAGRDPGGKEP